MFSQPNIVLDERGSSNSLLIMKRKPETYENQTPNSCINDLLEYHV